MPTRVTDNVWGFLWGKLVFGATGFVVSCVDAPVAEVLFLISGALGGIMLFFALATPAPTAALVPVRVRRKR